MGSSVRHGSNLAAGSLPREEMHRFGGDIFFGRKVCWCGTQSHGIIMTATPLCKCYIPRGTTDRAVGHAGSLNRREGSEWVESPVSPGEIMLGSSYGTSSFQGTTGTCQVKERRTE